MKLWRRKNKGSNWERANERDVKAYNKKARRQRARARRRKAKK